MTRPVSIHAESEHERTEAEQREGNRATHEERLQNAAGRDAESGRDSARVADDTRQSTL